MSAQKYIAGTGVISKLIADPIALQKNLSKTKLSKWGWL